MKEAINCPLLNPHRNIKHISPIKTASHLVHRFLSMPSIKYHDSTPGAFPTFLHFRCQNATAKYDIKCNEIVCKPVPNLYFTAALIPLPPLPFTPKHHVRKQNPHPKLKNSLANHKIKSEVWQALTGRE